MKDGSELVEGPLIWALKISGGNMTYDVMVKAVTIMV